MSCMTGGKQETAVGRPTGNVACNKPTAWAPLANNVDCARVAQVVVSFYQRRKNYVITGTGTEG